MKRNVFILCLLLLASGYGCSDDDNIIKHELCLSISSKSIVDNSFLNGGQYQILDKNGNDKGVYTLENGTININNISIGTYTIKEIHPPKGYATTDKEKTVNIISSDCQNAVFHYINEESREIPESMKVKFYRTDNNEFLNEYNAIRVGEYYWIDRNFSHVVPWGGDFENRHPITQALLDKYVDRIRIDPAHFRLEDITVFEKYYGRYYSYPSVLFMNDYGQVRNEYDEVLSEWRLPYNEDYRQLFAMCPFNTTHDAPHTELNERDVRFALGAREGDNPMAYNIRNENNSYKTYWFDNKNVTNKYKFNLMPSGARLNGDWFWCNGLGPDNGCYPDGKKGDIYHLFYTAPLSIKWKNAHKAIGTVTIHDLVDTYEHQLYHLLSVRWCRKLSDIELGYKLYINSDQTDIVKLDLEETPPKGYQELPNGYTRGFYVQYILNNPDPVYTVGDIIGFSRSVQDMYVYYNKNNKDIIF